MILIFLPSANGKSGISPVFNDANIGICSSVLIFSTSLRCSVYAALNISCNEAGVPLSIVNRWASAESFICPNPILLNKRWRSFSYLELPKISKIGIFSNFPSTKIL